VKRFVLAICIAAAWASVSPALAGPRVVPPGNRNAEQPKIPGSSFSRTQANKTNFEAKYQKVRDLFQRDRALIGKIKSVAAQYDIDPIHMLGAIAGEHTYNVDAYDYLQTYYVQAVSYAGDSFRFAHKGEAVAHFLARPQFENCRAFTDSYRLWICREEIWDKSFKGKTVDGTSFPNDRFAVVFFQPFYAGQTFGLGQGSPLMALALSDNVAEVSGYPKLSENRAGEVYEAIMNPDKSLAYMAANIRRSIDDYKTIAKVDISKNPGITATLYNVGRSMQRAKALAARGGALPEENYFGWFVNTKLEDLKKLL